MAEQTVELAPGESRVISFEATPHEAKTYQVSVDGLTGSFKALPAVGDFVYSNQVCGMATYLPAPSWLQATYSCRITNQGSRGTRTITFHYEYYHTYMGKIMGVYSESFELTLEPGQSYTFTRKSGDDFNQVFGSCARITMWLEDNAGGGTTPCVQETPYW